MNPVLLVLLLLPALAAGRPAPVGADVAASLETGPLVQLEVAVQDHGGRPVAGLAQDLFTVLDSGAEQEISRFQEVPAARVILLLDTSASMERVFWSARGAAWDLLRGLDPDAEVAVASCAHKPSLVSRFSRERADAGAALASLRLLHEEGSTLLACIGESAGLLVRRGHGARGAVVLVTDGRETSLSGAALQSAVDRLRRRLERAGVELHVLGYGRESWLAALARAGGGSWRAPWRGKDALGDLARLLGHHYRLGFRPGVATPGWRPVQVRVQKTGLQVHAPGGYHLNHGSAPGSPD